MTSMLLCLCLMTSGAVSLEARTLDGTVRSGAVVGWTEQALTLETDGGEVTLPVGDLVSIAAAQAAAEDAEGAGPRLWLVDGSRLAGEEFTLTGPQAVLTRKDAEPIRLERRQCVAVRFQAIDEQIGSEWRRLCSEPTLEDRLVVRKSGSIDYLGGTIRGVTTEAVQFELDGEVLPVSREKVFGIVLAQPVGQSSAAPLGTLTERRGNIWAIERFTLTDGRMRIVTPGDVEAEIALTELARLEFVQDQVVYLADLDPDRAQWTPYYPLEVELPALASYRGVRTDRDLPEKSWSIDGQGIRRGILLRSRTALRYRLSEPFRRFAATIGMDDAVRPRGHVVFLLKGDGRTLFEQAVAGSDPPVTLDVDLRGVRVLEVVVDFGEDAGAADQLIMGEARLVK